jgi:hypothetical protein
MTAHTYSPSHVASIVGTFLGHALAIVVGFVLMVAGLALGVTMIMLPLGLVIGLVGFAIFVAGFFAHPLQQGS